MGRREVIELGATAIAGLLVASNVISLLQDPRLSAALGGDFRFYAAATDRWLTGGGFYASYQLSGPYVVGDADVLFPPPILVLLVPFTILPPILWWIIPLAVVALSVWRLRPARWSWAPILLLVWYPQTEALIVAGNPVMWTVAALALGMLAAWPSVLVLVKPSLFPFAFFGSWRRSWWVALAALIALSVLFLPMWFDYVQALSNASGPRASVFHSVPDVPFMAVPIAAWLARRRAGIAPPSTGPFHRRTSEQEPPA